MFTGNITQFIILTRSDEGTVLRT